MDHHLILSMLKYAGIALVPIAAVWGLATTTTITDENKQKRLTWHGHIAIAMVVTGAIISAAAYGFELSMAASQRASAQVALAEKQAFERDQREASRDARERLDRIAIQGELRASELLRNQISGQLRQVEAERNARLRDLQLASQVGAGTRSNLARTQVALVGIGRLLQPIENLQITVTVRASLDGVQHNLGGQILSVRPTDPEYPSPQQNGDVYSFLQRKSASIHFALPQHGAFIGSNRSIDEETPIGGLNFVLIASRPQFVYYRLPGDDNVIHYDLSEMLARMTLRDDTIVSVEDLRSSVLLIELDNRLPAQLYPRSIRDSLRIQEVVLSFSGRRIVIDGASFQRAGTHGIAPLYGVSLARFIPR